MRVPGGAGRRRDDCPVGPRRAAVRAVGVAAALALAAAAGAAQPQGAAAAPAAQASDAASSAPAHEKAPEGWAYDLANELMSPFCPGRTLAECPSPQAADLRMWLVTQEAAGASREEVESILYQRFGDRIRSVPKPEGWGLTAYAVPLFAFLAGGGLVVLFLRHVRGGAGEGPTDPAGAIGTAGSAAGDAELERMVDREIERAEQAAGDR